MEDADRGRLAALVALARRRANRRVLAEALTLGLLPGLGAALVWRVLALVAGIPSGAAALLLPLALGLAAGAVLHLRRRLGPEEAALLVDRRAGTRERCVTGLRTGGAVARDALGRLDREEIRRALDFRPPASALAALLAAGALVALHLLPGIGQPAPAEDGVMSEVVLARGRLGGPAGGTPAPDPAPEVRPEEVARWIDRAEAPLPEGETARLLREAREAADRGDDEATRRLLGEALARATAADGGETGAAPRIRQALEAAGGAADRGAAGDPADRVAWGEDAPLVRRYLLLLDAARR